MMSSCSELLDRLEPEGHVVQFYGDDGLLLTRSVSRFLSEGLRRGDGLLVIATAEHRGSVSRQLKEELSYSKAILEGRLAFLDAETTLNRFLVDGWPDPHRFDDVVGEALRNVQARAGHTGVRAYGEMVGLLWKSGEHAAAGRLEELWNALLEGSQVCLFCAYPIDIFSQEFQVGKVDTLLCSHTHLLPLDGALEGALNRAMDEVLGARVDGLRRLIANNYRPSWAAIPRAEALVLWLRNNLPGSADQILERARGYYESGVRSRESGLDPCLT
jgi:MEDS: MEthanogen/methylotroph, DcmR Sensory domain